ncbi:MAG TPA: protein-disulfide reductase DsbD family protein, partial [Flavobacteriales bacterium]|nr:protein-disulfide reductase DsbD family protein [Flavobacteriales bacterium]
MLAAPGAPVKWSFRAVPQANGEVLVQCTGTLDEGWHVYALTLPSDQGPIATSIRLKSSDAYEAVGDLQEPTPVENYDPNFGMVVRYHDGAPIFTQHPAPEGGPRGGGRGGGVHGLQRQDLPAARDRAVLPDDLPRNETVMMDRVLALCLGLLLTMVGFAQPGG